MKTKHILVCIFLFAFIVHSVPTLMHENPVGIDSYYFLRIGKTLAENNFVLGYDELSFGGRPFSYPPGLPYFIGFISLFSDVELTGVLISIIVGALSSVLIFVLSMKVFEKNKNRSRISAASSVFFSVIPVVVWKTSALGSSVFVLFFVLLSVCIILYDEWKFFFLPVVALILISPAFAFLPLLFAAVSAGKKPKMMYAQVAVLLILAITASSFFLQGFSDVYINKNLPADIYKSLYPGITPADLLYKANPFVLIGGIIGLLMMIRQKERFLTVFSAVFILLLLAGMIEPDRGLFYLSVPMSMLFAFVFAGYAQTKRFFVLFSAMIILSMPGLALSYQTLLDVSPSAGEKEAVLFLKNSSSDGSVILSGISNGHFLSYATGRKNFVDGNLVNAPDLKERLDDMYAAYSDISARRIIIQSYNITHILVSEWESNIARDMENDTQLEKLFDRNRIKIYRVVS